MSEACSLISRAAASHEVKESMRHAESQIRWKGLTAGLHTADTDIIEKPIKPPFLFFVVFFTLFFSFNGSAFSETIQ